MAPNGGAEIHDDAWQTDAYALGRSAGSLAGRGLTMLARDCGSITFDARGPDHLGVRRRSPGPSCMFDPATLATLATFDLPPRRACRRGSPFQDFGGGGTSTWTTGGRVVTATTTRHIEVIAETPGGTGFSWCATTTSARVLTSAEEHHLGAARLGTGCCGSWPRRTASSAR